VTHDDDDALLLGTVYVCVCLYIYISIYIYIIYK
jgi:hypothetical protein